MRAKFRQNSIVEFSRLFFWSFSLLILLIVHTHADTTISDDISANTTWITANSPYLISRSVIVKSTATLTIEPGVTVKFDSGKSMQINGGLIARGTNGNPIRFTSNQANPARGDWGYIYFASSSVDATWDSNYNYVSGSVIEHSIIEYGGGGGVDSMLKIDQSSPLIKNSNIYYSYTAGIYVESGSPIVKDNAIEYNGSGLTHYSSDNARLQIFFSGNLISSNNANGIYIYASNFYATGEISSNTITKNNGGGLEITFNGTIHITSNTISHNLGRGIYLNSQTTYVTGNIISSNTTNPNFNVYGGACFLDSGNLTFTNNIVVNNTASSGDSAIRFYGGKFTAKNNQILGNKFYKGAVIYFPDLRADAEISQNLIAKNLSSYNGSSVFRIDAYSTDPVTITNNTISSNSVTYTIKNEKTVPQGEINTESNWWGTTISSSIESQIYDWYDNASYSIVDYSPYLSAPNTSAPISPPSGVAITRQATSISLSWTANPESDTAGYKVYYDADAGYPYANVVDVGNTTSYTLNTSNPYTTFVAVTAYDSDKDGTDDMIEGHESWFSEEQTPGAPAGPSLSGTPLGISSITWTWSDTSGEDGYRITTSTGGTRSGNLAAQTTFWTETDLSTNTSYTRYLAAFSSFGSSATAAISVYTLAAPPTGFRLTQVEPSSITVRWGTNTNSTSTIYNAYLWTLGGSTTTASVRGSSATFSDLSALTTYFLTVEAINGNNIATSCGLTLSTVTFYLGRATVAPDSSTIYQSDDGVRIEIPTGTISSTAQLIVETPRSPPAAPDDANIRSAGIVRDIRLSDGTSQLSQNVTITLSYNAGDISGLDESSLKLFYYDETAGSWVLIPNSAVNTSNRTVTASVNHFTLFAIMQYSTPASAISDSGNYPNPFSPLRGQSTRIRYTLDSDRDTEILIYDPFGGFVWSYSAQSGSNGGRAGPNEVLWNGSTGDGRLAGPGGYIGLIKSGGNTEKIKIGVK